MHGRLRGIGGHEAILIGEGWTFAACAPDSTVHPDALDAAGLDWTPARVPCTAASALRDAGKWDLDRAERRFDAEDWWFRTTFAAAPTRADEECWLCFDGLATVAEVWLNGALLLNADGMFTGHACRVDGALEAVNRLAIRFRSLDALLAVKRPRPRWRVPMLAHQQLRWFRTTLLGRTPGWSPPAAAVGPWQPITLERRRIAQVSGLAISALGDGTLTVSATVAPIGGSAVKRVALALTRGARRDLVPLARVAGDRFEARTQLAEVQQWWPHTHGEPALYDAVLQVSSDAGDLSVTAGPIGFRTVEVHAADGDFAVRVNGVDLFCRGACWTPLDVVRLDADAVALDAAFTQLHESGMNMVRVGGTMAYESDAFLDRCDATGVLLWQDLMFANMDYPEDDAGFAGRAELEVRQLLARLQGRPSVAVICGNSEGEQQAAMWGAPRERWSPPLFHERFARLVAHDLEGVPYWPSSAHGGAFPHQGNVGTTSYYGVGAYLRPLEDARRAEVRFASECLAFANIPESATLQRMPGGSAVRVKHAAWKARSPRDLGAGWDFDDVRDHYLGRLFDVDAAALRYADHERYLELGRAVSGEVMAATFLEWRRARSVTRGALVWFLRDLWPGAGWGVVDSSGLPKVAWHYLRRALAPVALGLSDEGGNGIMIQAINDRPVACEARVVLALYRQGEIRTGQGERVVAIPAQSAIEIPAAELFDGFHDLSYAYRFGPAPHELIAATLHGSDGAVLARAFHFIGALPSDRETDVGLSATLATAADGGRSITVTTRRFAQTVRVEVPGFRCEDDAFHLAPGESRTLALTPAAAAAQWAAHEVGRVTMRATVRALNSETIAKVSEA